MKRIFHKTGEKLITKLAEYADTIDAEEPTELIRRAIKHTKDGVDDIARESKIIADRMIK